MVYAVHAFKQVVSGLHQLQFEDVCKCKIKLIELASINWNLPFRPSFFVPLERPSYRMQMVTTIIKKLGVLSRRADFQHIMTIRISCNGFNRIDLDWKSGPGLGPLMTMQVAAAFVESCGLAGKAGLLLNVDSNG